MVGTYLGKSQGYDAGKQNDMNNVKTGIKERNGFHLGRKNGVCFLFGCVGGNW